MKIQQKCVCSYRTQESFVLFATVGCINEYGPLAEIIQSLDI